jgi:hypothetical protein
MAAELFLIVTPRSVLSRAARHLAASTVSRA